MKPAEQVTLAVRWLRNATIGEMPVKYNKRELEAISALNKIAYAFRHEEGTTLSLSEHNALDEVFGINIKKISLPKSQVKKLVRGKEDHLVEIEPGRSPGSWYPNTFCFFPFQVKERKIPRHLTSGCTEDPPSACDERAKNINPAGL